MTTSEIEKIYHLIAKNSGDVIWVLNLASLRFTYISPSVEQLRGFAPEEVIDQKLEDVLTPASIQVIQDYLPDRLEKFYQGDNSLRIMTHEMDQIHRDGSIIPTEVVTSLITNEDGQVIDILGVSRNITERKKIERQIFEKERLLQLQNEQLSQAKRKAEESDRLKTIFLQNMSHEIRTPMNAIMGFSDLLVTSFNNKTKLEYYSRIIRQRGGDLLELINDMLDLSKIEAGQHVVNPEEVDLKELLKELNDFFGSYCKTKGKESINLIFHTPEDPSNLEIITDRGKLKQILINLINNAIKFTKIGKIEIGVDLSEPDILRCYVSDTGIGIPEDQHHRIFERFLQINDNHSNPMGGTGLGLAIVKGLVELLGGEVQVKSSPGIGSTFSFTIRNRISEKPRINKTVRSARVKLSEEASQRAVLIVEDDIYSAAYLMEVLSDASLIVYHAAFGSEALTFIRENKIDLILLDMRLPEIDGFELAGIIKKEHPDIRIIAQSAYVMEEDQRKALEAGCDDFMPKPIQKEELLERLKLFLNL